MASQRDVKERIDSVRNIAKITRAMQMVAAARLRRAEKRIEALRPYADALRRMTRQAAEAAGDMKRLPVLAAREDEKTVALVLVTGDRGLAGAFNSQIMRAGTRYGRSLERDGKTVRYYAVGRRGASSLGFRGVDLVKSYVGFTDRPTFANARDIAEDLTSSFVDEEVDRVEIFYNGYLSPMSQEVRQQLVLPLSKAQVLVDDEPQEEPSVDEDDRDRRAVVLYEPEPEELLGELIPDYVKVSVYRALLESTASEHGARMTAMRNASENAGDLIDDLTLEMNRVRQAEITQEIMEVVAGAEGLSG